jgi:hypothetical protein
LRQEDLRKELEAREISASGFWSDDVKRLQIEFDREYEEQASERALRKEQKEQERKAQAAERAAKALLQKEAREEALELQANPKIQLFLKLIQTNSTPSHATLVCDSVLVRLICKTMISSNCTSLQFLELSRCGLNDDAGVHLARMIGSNTSIVSLNLELNNLGPATASAFGKHLRTNSTLKYLCLEGNNLTKDEEEDSGVKDLAHALQQNSTLTNLNLWRCSVGRVGGLVFAESLENNKTLIALDIGGSTADVVQLQKIASVLATNKTIYNDYKSVCRKERKTKRKEDQLVKEQLEAERKRQEEDAWIEEQRAKRAKERQDKKDAEAKRLEEERLKKEVSISLFVLISVPSFTFHYASASIHSVLSVS